MENSCITTEDSSIITSNLDGHEEQLGSTNYDQRVYLVPFRYICIKNQLWVPFLLLLFFFKNYIYI